MGGCYVPLWQIHVTAVGVKGTRKARNTRQLSGGQGEPAGGTSSRSREMTQAVNTLLFTGLSATTAQLEALQPSVSPLPGFTVAHHTGALPHVCPKLSTKSSSPQQHFGP